MSLARVIESRLRPIDGLQVRRLLPAPLQRMVGPFIFFDHFGPAELGPGEGMQVRPHPHINLATVTYLFEGEIVHRDSLGSHLSIKPGAINWMTAGRGIAHSERMPESLRDQASRLHGLQLWVALPTEHEEVEPEFHHYAAETLPEQTMAGTRLRLLAGTAYGLKSPVHVWSPLFYADATLEVGATLPLPDEHAERAAYLIEGAIEHDGERHQPGTMLVFNPGPVSLRALEPSKLVVLGGAPLDGARHIWWNFVSSSRERLEQAKRDWKEGRFAKIPGDDREHIPLPEE